MNLLIIGNGFDLAHGLPTKYSDFLDFLKEVESIAQFNTSLMLKKLSSEDKIKEYEKKAFVREFLIQINKSKTGDWKSSDGITQELFDNIKNNVWISYFQEINRKNKMKGINWIDFESEISQIIEIIDKEEENLYVPIPDSVLMEDYKISTFREKVRTRLSDKDKRVNEYIYKDLLDVTYEDLRKLVRCLEIYLSDCVEKANINLISPDIKELELDYILNFNYTHTISKVYKKFDGSDLHYIHGETRRELGRKNNMVLGIDEYRNEEERDKHINYNLYKKFTQRIINETGNRYREWICNMKEEFRSLIPAKFKSEAIAHNTYVFGHSLDVTDSDILREIITLEGTKTTIFYFDKQQQAQQIGNLVKMIGQAKFIEMVNSVPQRIVFQQQADMKEKS